jgi:hypothetical protein
VNNLLIRPYCAIDFEAVVKHYTDLPAYFTQRAVGHITRDLECVNTRDDYFCNVTELDGKIVGNLIFGRDYYGEDVYEFKWMAIDPTIKGKATIFKSLMLSGEALLKTEGRIFYLYTSDTENERKTQELFLQLGYEKIGVIPDYWDDGDGKVIFSKRNPHYVKNGEYGYQILVSQSVTAS